MATHEEALSEDGHPNRWRILAIMCLCLVLVVAAVSSLNLAIPSIIGDLNPSSTETLWIVDGYALVFAGLLLPAGALGDRYGRKGALLIGLGIFVVGAFCAAWSGDPVSLIVARGSMGVGAALIMPATLSIIISVFPADGRAKAIATWAGFAGAGGAIGIIGGGALLEAFWWGSVFFINVPIALLAALCIAVAVPTSRDEHATPLDPIGAVLSIAGLGALVYAIIEGGEAGWGAGVTVGFFVAAVVLLGAWVAWESSAEHPMLSPKLFRRIPFSMGSLTLVAGFAVMFGMFFLLTQYFQFVQGHSPLEAGLRNLPFALTMVIVSPRSPVVAERLGKRGAIATGLLVQAAGFAVLAMHEADTPFRITAIGLVLLGIGMALLMPAASEAIVSSLPPSKAGVGSAWNDSTREIGGALGIAVLGTLLSTGYRSGVEDVASQLPGELGELVAEGIGPGLRVAAAEQRPDLVTVIGDAFVDGMTLAFWSAAVFGGVIAAIVWIAYHSEPAQVAEVVV